MSSATGTDNSCKCQLGFLALEAISDSLFDIGNGLGRSKPPSADKTEPSPSPNCSFVARVIHAVYRIVIDRHRAPRVPRVVRRCRRRPHGPWVVCCLGVPRSIELWLLLLLVPLIVASRRAIGAVGVGFHALRRGTAAYISTTIRPRDIMQTYPSVVAA